MQAGYFDPLSATQEANASFGGHVFLGFSEYFGLEVGSQYAAVTTLRDPEGLSQGRLTSVPIYLGLQARLPLQTVPLAFFLRFGGGYAVNSYTLDNNLVQSYDALGLTVTETIKNSPHVQLGAGVDFRFSYLLSLELFFQYRLMKGEGTWEMADQVTDVKLSGDIEKLKLDSLCFGIGLRFTLR